MNSLPWFRMWADAIDDEKLKILAFEDRWHFVAILCLKRKGVLDTPNDANLDRKVAAKLGLAHREAQEVLDRLVDADLVSPDWQPLGWERRQFESDVSTERVRKFREKRKGNVSETPSENRLQISDTEKKKKEDARERALGIPGLNREAFERWERYRTEIRKPLRPASLCSAAGALSKYGDQQAAVVEQSIAQGWQGLFDLRTKNGKSADPIRTWRPEDDDEDSHV